MSLHTIDLEQKLHRFLERRAPPSRLKDKPQAQVDEVRALVSCLARNAPRSDLAIWWPKFEAALGEVGSRFWPTEKEIREAARATGAPASTARLAEAEDVDRLRVAAARMSRGEPVGEGFLWGAEAVALHRSGLVSEDLIGRYRSAAFGIRRATYGEEAARGWEAGQQAAHDLALRAARQRDAMEGMG